MGGYFVLAAENSHPAQLYRDPHAGIKLCFGWLGRTYWELEYRGGRSRMHAGELGTTVLALLWYALVVGVYS